MNLMIQVITEIAHVEVIRSATLPLKVYLTRGNNATSLAPDN